MNKENDEIYFLLTSKKRVVLTLKEAKELQKALTGFLAEYPLLTDRDLTTENSLFDKESPL